MIPFQQKSVSLITIVSMVSERWVTLTPWWTLWEKWSTLLDPDLRVRLATADRGLFMLSGSPSFQPGTWPDRGLFWTFSQKMSRPPASQSDPTLTWSALDGLVVLWWWFADWIRMMAAGEEGLWGGGDFLRPVKSRLVLVIP